MKRLWSKLGSFCYFFACTFVLFTNHAHAYIDPSTTTYIIQGIAGILIAIGAMFTVFRHKIKAAWQKWYYGRIAKKNERQQKESLKEDK